MMKIGKPFQPSFGNHYEDSPSSEEDNEEVTQPLTHYINTNSTTVKKKTMIKKQIKKELMMKLIHNKKSRVLRIE